MKLRITTVPPSADDVVEVVAPSGYIHKVALELWLVEYDPRLSGLPQEVHIQGDDDPEPVRFALKIQAERLTPEDGSASSIG